MRKKEDEFIKKLMAAFKLEAEEHLKTISSGLLDLEKTPQPEKRITIIETIFRETHSLKGAARSVNMTVIESVCRSLESIFSAWKRRNISLSPEQFDILYQALDTIKKLLSSPEEEQTGISELLEQIDRLAAGESAKTPDSTALPPEDEAPPAPESYRASSPEPAKPEKKKPEKTKEKEKPSPIETAPGTHAPLPQDYLSAKEKPAPTETVRISAAELDSILRQIEEMPAVKLATGQRAVEIRDALATIDLWKKEWGKEYPRIQMIRKLPDKEPGKKEPGQTSFQTARLLKFLDWNLAYIKSLENRLTALERSAEQDYRALSGMVEHLLEDMQRVLMLPFSSLLEIFPKLVRDLSRDQSKEVKLEIKGGEVKVDRRIMEEMKVPLIHLVRNCIDHGIEKPRERERKKKTPSGLVVIAISHLKSNQIEILVSDDGAGIDLERVKNAAVKRRVILEKKGRQLDNKELLGLIFESGVSTSPIITDISGRGLGLAIVREKIERLGGLISVETAPGKGTSFRLLLPITLATFRGVLVEANEQLFVVPTANVERSVRIKKEEIKTVENRETVHLDGRTISLVRLGEVLGLPHKMNAEDNSGSVLLLVLGNAGKSIAFSVDKILNEQEVLIKSLVRQLTRVRNISGATVLGSGRVVPILNVPDLMKSAVKVTASPFAAAAGAKEAVEKKKSVLVVEDSITARMLIKNILEMAGYQVKAAVDGVDAFTILRTEGFDLVVSDIDMPRMNGIELTSRIRSDKKLAELPVVLVTALESREDRERGIDVGANAYIVKSSFDQSNLLEVVRRLI
ncbi:MAG TPA: hybrid sensor histidine kinase/response regulator [archaeon]|nr:hybrid sensor histidine kinase/response regulator [archaeon]